MTLDRWRLQQVGPPRATLRYAGVEQFLRAVTWPAGNDRRGGGLPSVDVTARRRARASVTETTGHPVTKVARQAGVAANDRSRVAAALRAVLPQCRPNNAAQTLSARVRVSQRPDVHGAPRPVTGHRQADRVRRHRNMGLSARFHATSVTGAGNDVTWRSIRTASFSFLRRPERT
jgi:hypothetical protein